MKIDGIKNKPISGKSVKKKKLATGDISFVSMLENQLAPLGDTSPVKESQAVGKSSSGESSTRLTGLALSEKTIDILAAFSRALEDLSLSAESLHPLVEALEGETTALLDIKEQLDADDPLAELLDRVAAVAYLETEKFRRGDYDKR